MSAVSFIAERVKKALPDHPTRARHILMAVYRAVALKGKLAGTSLKRPPTYTKAVDAFNGAIARTIADSLTHPQTAVMVNLYVPCEALFALGVTPMFPEGVSVYVACTEASLPFVQIAEENALPESFCSYHKLMLGMDAAGVLPKPAAIVHTTLACDANQVSFRRIAANSTPRFVIEVPYWQTEEAIANVAMQLKSSMEAVARVLNKTLDEKKLIEVCTKSYKTLQNTAAYLRLRARGNIPTTLTGELCQFIVPHVFCGSDAALQFSEQLLSVASTAAAQSEFRSALHKPYKATPKESYQIAKTKPYETAQKELHESVQEINRKRPRIFWIHTLPNWQRSVADLFEQDNLAEIVGNDMAYDQVDILDELDPQKPWDFMARRLVKGSSNGPASRRIEAALRAARISGADGAILFAHWGCRQTAGMVELARTAFEEAGIPLLVLEGDGCDPRNAPTGQMATRLQAFIEQLSKSA